MESEKSISLSRKSNRYKYDLFYRKDTGQLYAYTDNRTLAKGFKITRKESIFIHRNEMLSSSDLKDIHAEVPDALLQTYRFNLDSKTIVLPITTRERLELEHVVAQALNVSIYLTADINPNIFTHKIQELLKKISYTDVYNDYHDSSYNRKDSVKPDYLTCFLSLYGDTMKERW